jgi:FeS assembly protein IscX
MTWHDIEDIAEALYEAKQDIDPLAVRFTDLRDWIAALPEWEDDIHLSNEAKLEAVQMEWYELWKEDHTA